MKKIYFLALFTFFLSLFLTSCSSDEELDESNGVTTGNYWPMAVNNQWTYKYNGVLSTPSKIMKILLFFLLSQFHEFGNLKYFLYSPVAFSPGSLELRGPDSSDKIVKNYN